MDWWFSQQNFYGGRGPSAIAPPGDAVLHTVFCGGGWMLDAAEVSRQPAACDRETEQEGRRGNAAEWSDEGSDLQ